MNGTDLYWLPRDSRWLQRLATAESREGDWPSLVSLAGFDLDALRTDRLDRLLRTRFPEPPPDPVRPGERVAILGTGTVGHLLPAIRVAGLRRGLWVDLFEGGYGSSLPALLDSGSALHRFAPTAVLFAVDAWTMAVARDSAIAQLQSQWQIVQETFGCAVLQQTFLPVGVPLMGSNEHRLAESGARRIAALNDQLRTAADDAGVDLVAVDAQAAQHGLDRWHDPVLWHHAKQEISPRAAPLYGDLVMRVLGAKRGLSRRVLVLDLDDTLWGGEVGEVGADGLVLGPGSAEGEAFAQVQAHALALARRGVVLAVCSKNDEPVARAAFEQHPEMLLKPADIACFVANWSDKASNLERIAEHLRLSLDSFVLLDDSAFERDLVRRALPMVAVPELPDEPALFSRCIADAGYFEAVQLTTEDRARTGLYRTDDARQAVQRCSTDLQAYLEDLEMRLVWQPFDAANFIRIHQLVNKTNQFNLTTRRYTDAELRAVMQDADAFGLQFRLLDRLGDNGMIAVVIGRLQPDGDVALESWLMSCRVIGRRVEEAILPIVVEMARRRGSARLIGLYRPTSRNAMVAELYPGFGFTRLPDDGDVRRFALHPDAMRASAPPIIVEEAQHA